MITIIYLSLVLLELVFILGLFYYIRKKVKEIEDNMCVLISSINKVSYQAFKVGEDFENHCHEYEFNDGVLYIKKPIIEKISEEKNEISADF